MRPRAPARGRIAPLESRRWSCISNLFGNLASGVIRLAVAVGIIAATYLFLVKPVLHTTDNAINKSFGPGGIGGIQRQIDHAINSANGQVRRQVQTVLPPVEGGRQARPREAAALRPAGQRQRQPDAGLRQPLLSGSGGGAATEVGGPLDRAVEARPRLALGQLALEPVEAPEAPAEVVDHVDEHRLAGAGSDR